MVEALDVTQEAVVPNGVDADVYDRIYTEDTGNLASIGLRVHYQKDGVDCAVHKIDLSDGVIGVAMKRAYEIARPPVYDPACQAAYDAAIAAGKKEDEAQAAGRAAGNQALIAAGVTMGDPQATWSATQAKIAANETAKDLVKLLASKDWGKLILRKMWKREAV